MTPYEKAERRRIGKELFLATRKLADFLKLYLTRKEDEQVEVHVWQPKYGGIRIAEISVTGFNHETGNGGGYSYMRNDAIYGRDPAAALILACEEWLVGRIYGDMESTPPGNPLHTRMEAEEKIHEWFEKDKPKGKKARK